MHPVSPAAPYRFAIRRTRSPSSAERSPTRLQQHRKSTLATPNPSTSACRLLADERQEHVVAHASSLSHRHCSLPGFKHETPAANPLIVHDLGIPRNVRPRRRREPTRLGIVEYERDVVEQRLSHI